VLQVALQVHLAFSRSEARERTTGRHGAHPLGHRLDRPPFPAASRPSSTTTIRWPVAFTILEVAELGLQAPEILLVAFASSAGLAVFPPGLPRAWRHRPYLSLLGGLRFVESPLASARWAA